MKAVVVTPYYHPKIGGLENYARQLNIALQTLHNWEIVIISSNDSSVSITEVVDNQRIYRLGTWFKVSNTPFSLRWSGQIRTIIREEKPDLILAHAPVPSLADAAVRAKDTIPFIVIYHAATIFKQDSPLFNLAARVYNLYGRASLARADRIWAVSEFVRQELPAQLQAKTSVLPNAVWAHEVTKRQQPSAPHFVFISNLNHSHAWKGLSDVLRAVAIYANSYNPRVALTVIGDGNARKMYEKQAQTLGIKQNVTFRGALVGREKERILQRGLALILYPTTANDAFPTVLLEAWSMHLPAIASAIGPLPSLIHQGYDGFLCEPNQPAALAKEMNHVASLSPSQRQRIAKRASKRVSAEYTWEHQARLATQFVGELL
jgi:glycosyltransferase involved in cell wall biosynthesis